ncbi:MAG: YvcK family protein [Candidatus Moranbacteria bacterium]|nr:YvcK family protein [Candidatus Moranbacteria bacterium]
MAKKIKKVVTIGGGTGSFMLLSGLKNYPIELSAIVSMADDGGSTGILRDELGVLPPGDVRQCLAALSGASDIMRTLMTYRFEEGGLKGHNFGNLLLSALEKITGNFSAGVTEAAKILNIKGEVIPVADKEVNLFIELKNGKLIKGENEVRHNFEIKKAGIKKSFLKPIVKANKKAVQKILEADLIVIGPGDYYGSIMPNFLVQGISEALRNTKAVVVFNCNLVNRKGQTDNFTLDDYANLVNEQIGKERIDFVTFNTKEPGKNLIKKYEEESMLVDFGEEKDQKRTYRIIKTDLLSDKKVRYSKADAIAATRAFIRHDSEKLARVLMVILELGKYEGIINEIV